MDGIRDCRRARWLMAGLLVTWSAAGCDRAPASSGAAGGKQPSRMQGVVRAIDAAVRSGRALPGAPPSTEERAQLRQLYQAFANTPLWLTASGDLRGVGKDAAQRLLHADAEGLEPEDYAAAQLDSLAQAGAQKDTPPDAVARLDAGMSLAMLRYLRDIHAGRVNPRAIGLAIDAPQDRHDYVRLLGEAVREGNLDDVVNELLPPLAQYGLVKQALTRYRAMEQDSTADVPLRLPVPLKVGAPAPPGALDQLARRLALLGDYSGRPGGTLARYDGTLVEAVHRFQARHGLSPDSVLGQATLDELNVPLSWRIHQLELSLERLRWIHDLEDAPYLLVNIPMFELTAWRSPREAGPPAFRTGVIVGKALDTQTPVLVEEMRYVVFQPYWNVPPSIVRDEVIPEAEKNKDYLRKNDMEIVQGQGDDADLVEPSSDALDQVARGELRIRQRPGPGNALGPIKFVFPNDQNVYLHGTPAEQLFDRTRRDFSHGCVRVEDPTGLAEWVLADQPEWTRDRITEAMEDPSKKSRRVSLTHPLRVLLFYTTASVESDGTVRFAKDIYGHDRRLDTALHLAGS